MFTDQYQYPLTKDEFEFKLKKTGKKNEEDFNENLLNLQNRNKDFDKKSISLFRVSIAEKKQGN